MFKIKSKPLLYGVLFFIVDIFFLYNKLSNPAYSVVSNRADLMDGYFGFFLLAIFFLLSFALISYGFGFKSKFSRVGEKVFDFINSMYSSYFSKKKD